MQGVSKLFTCVSKHWLTVSTSSYSITCSQRSGSWHATNWRTIAWRKDKGRRTEGATLQIKAQIKVTALTDTESVFPVGRHAWLKFLGYTAQPVGTEGLFQDSVWTSHVIGSCVWLEFYNVGRYRWNWGEMCLGKVISQYSREGINTNHSKSQSDYQWSEIPMTKYSVAHKCNSCMWRERSSECPSDDKKRHTMLLSRFVNFIFRFPQYNTRVRILQHVRTDVINPINRNQSMTNWEQSRIARP